MSLVVFESSLGVAMLICVISFSIFTSHDRYSMRRRYGADQIALNFIIFGLVGILILLCSRIYEIYNVITLSN